MPYRYYLIIGIVVFGIIGGGGYFGFKWWQAYKNSPEVLVKKADEEKVKILASLGKLMVMPEGDPVLFKVNDQEVMRKQQAFFKDTKNDDILLVFQQSGKAILYRPSTNVIVNVGPVNFDQDQKNTQVPANTQSTSTTKESVKTTKK